MSLQSVRAFLAEYTPDIEILEKPTSTATVAEAARAHNMEPAQIAKTLSLRLRDEIILLILAGDAKIDNRKYKDQLDAKAAMLNADEVLMWTSHLVGAVCPFGLPHLRRHYAEQVRCGYSRRRRHQCRGAYKSRATLSARRGLVGRCGTESASSFCVASLPQHLLVRRRGRSRK
jgi:prolyl-tRNA editing enzyme YbaK/EbsC (Cys-tRNA(Pro) deacylase)